MEKFGFDLYNRHHPTKTQTSAKKQTNRDKIYDNMCNETFSSARGQNFSTIWWRVTFQLCVYLTVGRWFLFITIVRLSFSEAQMNNVDGLFQVLGLNLTRWRTVTLQFRPNNCANCTPRPCHDQAKSSILVLDVKVLVFYTWKTFLHKGLTMFVKVLQ